MTEVLLWRLIAGAALAIVSYMAQQWFKALNLKIDDLIKAIKDVAVLNEKQNGDIRIIKEVQELHNKRLDSHARRIEKIENKKNP